jgi:imidazolonepropionase-like amidohydrolase
MDFYRKGLAVTGAVHRAGVPIMVGSDAPDAFVFPGSAVHDEMGELVAAGLSPAEALRAATLNGAVFLKVSDSYGTVESGKRADLVLLDANPLEDIGNTRRIRALVFGGRFFDRNALDQLLDGALEAATRPVTRPGAGGGSAP